MLRAYMSKRLFFFSQRRWKLGHCIQKPSSISQPFRQNKFPLLLACSLARGDGWVCADAVVLHLLLRLGGSRQHRGHPCSHSCCPSLRSGTTNLQAPKVRRRRPDGRPAAVLSGNPDNARAVLPGDPDYARAIQSGDPSSRHGMALSSAGCTGSLSSRRSQSLRWRHHRCSTIQS